MRKIKKINGYLVVKFNDREKREHEGTALGEYGVIDAELYTGDLDIDRGAMEYDDADSLEVAVELARGLESEEDITDEPSTYTVITETNDTFTEEDVHPHSMIEGWENQLKAQINSTHHPDIDSTTAAHELYGFKVALNRVGLLPDDETYVDPDHFAPAMHEAPLPQSPEEMLTHICDIICKERIPGRTQEELDTICAACAVDRLYSEAESRQLRARENALGDLNAYITQLADPELLPGTAHRLEYGTRQYMKALQTVRFLTDREIAAFEVQIEAEVKKPRDATTLGFRHTPPGCSIPPSALYDLGVKLVQECPENDCVIYRNIFKMASEIDTQLDYLEGCVRLIVEREYFKRYREMEQMYRLNHAVRCFRVEEAK